MKPILCTATLAFSLFVVPLACALDPELRELFNLWDGNGDEIVEGQEYHLGGGAPQFYDINKDGVLTLEEYARHRGQPLDDVVPALESVARTAADSRAPAVLPSGQYSCLHVYYDFLNKRMMMDTVGTLSITGAKSYIWVGAVSGEYIYDPAGSINWLSGSFAETNVLESTVEMKGNDLMVKIAFETDKKTITYRCYLDG